MSMLDDILACLQGLGAAVYPLYLPLDEKGAPTRLPAIVYRQVGGGGVYSHDKGPAAYEPLWEFRCWADTYAGAKRLARSVTGAIDALGMQATSETDDREPETGTPNVIVTAAGFFTDEEV
jgi:hypothetical protein